jgi:uncharacterized membrane protein YqjE
MPAEVVTLDVVDMDNLRLQQEVLLLQSRLYRLVAVLRLLVVVLKVSRVTGVWTAQSVENSDRKLQNVVTDSRAELKQPIV